MRSLNITPEEWARRLGRGAAQLAERQGYDIHYLPETWRGKLKDALSSGNPLQRVYQNLIADRMGGAVTVPPVGGGRGAILLTGTPQTFGERFVAGTGGKELVLHHEAREAQRMGGKAEALKERLLSGKPGPPVMYKRLGRKAEKLKPVVSKTVGAIEGAFGPAAARRAREIAQLGLSEGLLMGVDPQLYSSAHADPTLPIRDVRQARLLPLQARADMRRMRLRSGEAADMAQAAGKPRAALSELRLPRHKVKRMAEDILRQQQRRAAEIANVEASPVARRYGAQARKTFTAPLRLARRLLGR